MSSQAGGDAMPVQEAERTREGNEEISISDTESDSSSEADSFERYASCFVGGETTAYQVQAKVLAFVAGNIYAVCKSTAIAASPGEHRVQDIEFELKHKRPLSEMAADAMALDLPSEMCAYVFIDEATDPVTHVPQMHLVKQVVKPMLEKCYNEYGAQYLRAKGFQVPGCFKDFTDCILDGGTRSDFVLRTSFGVVGNDNIIVLMSMYEKPIPPQAPLLRVLSANHAGATAGDVSCILRLRFMHLAHGQTYASEFQESDIDDDYLPIPDSERFLPCTHEVYEHHFRGAVSFSVCGGQFVVDKIIDNTLSFVENFLKSVCANQPGYQSGCKHAFEIPVLFLCENRPNDSRDHAIILNLLCDTMRDRIDDLLTNHSGDLRLCDMEEKDELDFDEGWNLEAQAGQESSYAILEGEFFRISWAYVLGPSALHDGVLRVEMKCLSTGAVPCA